MLQTQTRDEFDGDYKSVQFSFVKRMANRWSGRLAYTLQKSHYVGLGNPDARRVWLDNDIARRLRPLHLRPPARARRQRHRQPVAHVQASRPSSARSPARRSTRPSARDVNGDNDNNDRPIKGIDDLTRPIRSELDSQGRAVINGLEGPGSFLVDLSFRYQIPLDGGLESLDLFYDIFNVLEPRRTSCRRPATARRRSS